jgi:hypothetical protein
VAGLLGLRATLIGCAAIGLAFNLALLAVPEVWTLERGGPAPAEGEPALASSP